MGWEFRCLTFPCRMRAAGFHIIRQTGVEFSTFGVFEFQFLGVA
jgi:hypothetical protein